MSKMQPDRRAQNSVRLAERGWEEKSLKSQKAKLWTRTRPAREIRSLSFCFECYLMQAMVRPMTTAEALSPGSCALRLSLSLSRAASCA